MHAEADQAIGDTPHLTMDRAPLAGRAAHASIENRPLVSRIASSPGAHHNCARSGQLVPVRRPQLSERGTVLRLEELRGGVVEAAHGVVVEHQAADAAVLGQGAGLRLDQLSGVDA